MSDTLQLDYYYGIEADQFKFYRVPKLLITHPAFKGLSSDAKLAYGLMLDRMSLSISSGWMDEEKRAFIYYTLEEIMEDLDCSRGTCNKILKELDSVNGIGLIEKVRQGLGKPDKIYVKNFASITITADEENHTPEDHNTEPETGNTDNETSYNDSSEEKSLSNPDKITEVQNLDFKKSKNYTSRSIKNEPLEVQDLDVKKSKNQTSGSIEFRLQEVQNLDPNNTDINNTDKSETEINETNPINLSRGGRVSIRETIAEKKKMMDGIDRTEETEYLTALIKKNIEYDAHMKNDDYDDRQLYDEMYQLICETVCVKKGTIPIEGQDFPQEIVKSRFLKLDSNHLEYVRECMKKTTTKIGNIKKYLLTALYNAPSTIGHYYQQEVQHDLYGSEDFYNSKTVDKLREKYGGAI